MCLEIFGKFFDENSIEKLYFYFIFILENVILKIEPSEIPFFYNNFFGLGGGDLPLPPLATPLPPRMTNQEGGLFFLRALCRAYPIVEPAMNLCGMLVAGIPLLRPRVPCILLPRHILRVEFGNEAAGRTRGHLLCAVGSLVGDLCELGAQLGELAAQKIRLRLHGIHGGVKRVERR